MKFKLIDVETNTHDAEVGSEADDEDMTLEQLFNQILQEYNWYGEAVKYEVK